MLLHIDGSGGVNIREDFAVAGEGGYLAQTALLHRQHSETTGSLEETMYCVFEAKKYAERVASVNSVTHGKGAVMWVWAHFPNLAVVRGNSKVATTTLCLREIFHRESAWLRCALTRHADCPIREKGGCAGFKERPGQGYRGTKNRGAACECQ